MHKNEHAVEIDASPAQVFPYLVEGERRLRWMGALKETTPLTDGPPAQGSRWRDVFEQLGQRFALQAELVAYEPPEHLKVRLTSNAADATSEQWLEQVDGRTRVRTVLRTEFTSFTARLAAGVVVRHAQQQLEADLQALKALVESPSR